MRTMIGVLGLILAATTVTAGAAPASRQVLRLDGVAARVVVIPQARHDMDVRISGRGAASLGMERHGAVLTVRDTTAPGRLERWAPWLAHPACIRPDDVASVRAHGAVTPLRALPLIVARVPADAVVEASGATYGRIEPAASLSLTQRGCGAWTAARVDGLLTVRQEGNGRLTVDNAWGPLDVQVDGAGHVAIAAGISGHATLRVKGNGRIEHGGQIGTFEAAVDGNGQVLAKRVNGRVETSLKGYGVIDWGRPEGKRFCTRC